MKEKSEVTIIVPIYNVELYIEKCLKSLMIQTFNKIEIWAINDGTPDNSMKIVEKYAENDDRIKCINKENGGYGSVLEYAISRITTKYFLICDSDDWLEPNAVEDLYNIAEENDVDLVVGEKNLTYNTSKIEKDCGITPCYEIEHNIVYEELENFVFFSVTPHAKLYKTELAQNIVFPHKVSYTDTILFLKYISNASKAIYINKALANYFIDRPGNTTEDLECMSQKTFDGMMTMLNSLYTQIEKDNKLSSAIYYRMYLLCMLVMKRTNYKDKEFNENIDKLIIFLDKLRLKRKDMYKYIRDKNLLKKYVKKIFYNLLFCKKINKIIIKKYIYYIRKGVKK